MSSEGYQTITSARLRNQRLSGGRVSRPEDVVRWLGAVQAQEYPDTKWGLALRMRRGSDATIERAFDTGAILRTHLLRPTWHFVTPEDIRWMLALTGPRVSARMAPYNRQLELDGAVFRRGRNAIAGALRDGARLTRQELKTVLQGAGITALTVQRLAHIVMQAELDGIICSGGRRGKQQTYALLDQRVASCQPLSRDESLAELARRYFTSHGPAQLQDFVWWSGLTTPDARAGLALTGRELVSDEIDGKTYWSSAARPPVDRSATTYLLPLYDEYLIAYKDRGAALDRSRSVNVAWQDPFGAPVVVNGKMVAGWRRSTATKKLVVTIMPLRPLRAGERQAIADAAQAYASFAGRGLALTLTFAAR